MNSVASIVESLQRYYTYGIIAYPRVDNNFMVNSVFSLFPHPSFNCLGIPALQPIATTKKLPIIKKNSLLYLSISGIIRPSDAVTISKEIDKYLDEDLLFKSNKIEMEYLDYMDEFKIFLNESGETRKSLLGYMQSFYRDNKDTYAENTVVSNIENVIFDNVDIERKLEKKRFLSLKFDKQNRELREEELDRQRAEYLKGNIPIDDYSVAGALTRFEVNFKTNLMLSIARMQDNEKEDSLKSQIDKIVEGIS